jgi:hypothetical protein
MKLAKALILILLLGSCSYCSSKPKSKHSKIAETVTKRTVQRIESETSLRVTAFGGWTPDNQVRYLSIGFNHLGELSIEQARKFIIYCINEYMSETNTDIEIRPYLNPYPFTQDEMKLIIFIKKANGKDVNRGTFCVVVAQSGLIEYNMREPSSKELRTILRESYEEAVDILEAEKITKNSSSCLESSGIRSAYPRGGC